MKKLFFVIVSIMLTMTTFAQNKQESEHLAFKGVPIDGTLKDYTEAMKSAGFTYLGTEDGISFLQGDFAGYRGCTIVVCTLKKLDLVSTIGVLFPEQETWSSLYSNYSFLKEMLTKKYGKPTDEAERFDSYSTPNDDNSRMHELIMDRCKYYTIFSTPKGDIKLSIQHNGLSCFVRLKYYDKINTDKVREEALNDL